MRRFPQALSVTKPASSAAWLLPLVVIAVAGCGKRAAPEAVEPAAKSVAVTSSSGVAMVLIPGGTFLMGSEAGGDESPRHEVRVSPFAMDVYEVSQKQFLALEIPDPSHFKSEDRPVEQLRWLDAAEFCNARSKAEGLAPCYDELTFACDFEATGYRLPTEAEWEYAARAGSKGDYFFGNSAQKLKSFACFAGNSRKKTDPVGRKRPNAWGLHDMLGNVAEWCNDIYADSYYRDSPRDNPRGPSEGRKRVMRGGSWKSIAAGCRVTARQGCVAGFTDACFTGDTLGFRCARRLSESELQEVTPNASKN